MNEIDTKTLTIGILGGMGPRATAVFHETLLTKLAGTDQLLPRIICSNNGAIPDRTKYLLGNGEDPLEILKFEARLLQKAGVDIVCMPCNTAHSPRILSRLMATVPLPVLDMPAACMLFAEEYGAKEVLILGTRGTIENNIFSTRTFLPCVYPTPSQQSVVDLVIKSVKSGEVLSKNTIKQIQNIVNSSRADTIILGCTELSSLASLISTEKLVIDSLDVLASQCSTLCNKLY